MSQSKPLPVDYPHEHCLGEPHNTSELPGYDIDTAVGTCTGFAFVFLFCAVSLFCWGIWHVATTGGR